MGLRERMHRLEKQMGLRDKGESCTECGGRILLLERHEDGTTYPFEEPCESCDGGPGVRFIEVMLGEGDGA